MASSSRRPPGPTGGGTATTKQLWTWTLLALLAATTQTRAQAQAQAQAQKLDHVQPISPYRSQTTAEAAVSTRRTQAGRSPPEIPLHDIPTAKYSNNEREDVHIPRYHDALAPAHGLSAVRAPLAQSSESAGLAHNPSARLLQDWEAEDIILLSTIDGALHARDRKTGQERWTIEMPDQPMIKTVHMAQNRSDVDDASAQDDWRFVVEPSPDGQLFALFKDARLGLIRAEKTVKKMAAEVPSFFAINGVRLTVTSEQKSKFYAIDLSTGEILNTIPRDHSIAQNDMQPRCRRRNELEVEDPACKPGRTIRIGRNQYTFTISEELSGMEVATIFFSEWMPNLNDKDLQENYRKSLDGYEVQSSFNGRIVGMDYSAKDGHVPMYNHKLDSPVARIFDVVRPLDDDDAAAHLVLLSRPMDLPVESPEAHEWRLKQKHSQKVYLDRLTDAQNVSHWYALSEYAFPGITYRAPWAKTARYQEDDLFYYHNQEDLIGVHMLSRDTTAAPIRLTISDSEHNDPQMEDDRSQLAPTERPQVPAELPPNVASISLSTGILVLMAWTLVMLGGMFLLLPGRGGSAARTAIVAGFGTIYMALVPKAARKFALPSPPALEAVSTQTVTEKMVQLDAEGVVAEKVEVAVETGVANGSIGTPAHSRAQSTASAGGSPTQARPSDQADNDSEADSDDEDGSRESGSLSREAAKPKKRTKTKRGKRGGKGNKKKTMDPTMFDEKPILAVEQHLHNSMLQVGTLKIDTREDTCLGRGSNGTTVYPGTFHGREVAVKRLIKSTNDLAKKEIQHLMSSDENPHVIRFYTHEESRDFFYIALDRFTASLDQFIEHPHLYPMLISDTKGFDVKDCLQQITRGVQHLHSLKLVHRDIKPQNVLVKSFRSNRPSPEMPPLLFVISDFGLCKPLDEGAMSTFAPTANHTAAGTTGWRAPELLVSPRDIVAAPNAQSSHSVSTNHSRDGTVIDPPTGRRATKAIDIFSLGCVFYYVMTQGGHPFDKGGSSLGRDLNIKENNLTTDLLKLHKYEYDADDLILQMLQHDPRNRPDCSRVLRHPYFWSQEHKLDFICLVSDCYEGEKNSINNIHDEHALRTPAEQMALAELAALEDLSRNVIGTKHDGSVRDFLTALPKSFINEMGRQRKYTGTKMIDLLRVIRNKKNHFKDLPADIREMMLKNADGQLAGYYQFWAERFPSLLINCHAIVVERMLAQKFGLERWYD